MSERFAGDAAACVYLGAVMLAMWAIRGGVTLVFMSV